MRSFKVPATAACCLLSAWSAAPAQTTAAPAHGSVNVNGLVSDPSGARVGHATVEARSADNVLVGTATSDSGGRFHLSLPPGPYRFVVSAEGFDPYLTTVKATGASVTIDAKLVVATTQTVVSVNGNTGASTAEDANGSALALTDKQLGNLSDDDATFQQQLTALAGGDGQHAPQLYVDGFSGGQFPPKNSIRAVKINQNPFSAEYDGLGFGRIEIFTKPGTGRLHGSLDITGDPSGFNSRNPFLHQVEPATTASIPRPISAAPSTKRPLFF